MAQLDPDRDGFWNEQKDHLVAHGILNKGKEYTLQGLINLSKKLEKSGTSCNVFNKIKKNDRKSFRKNYESNPDLSSMKKVRRHSSARTRVLK
jgi:hypothetical protein|uniref:ORF92B n=1 Tax=Oryza sativa subsp. japonica TaxID=39947 RepID=Q35319_ORYSJ|nr:ORF92B [Oryza sativa Japonica Group]